ncbi:hypothetical protein GCM10011608_39870 [Micromonospora sonchi]|uniref:LPXTG-motif cell wall anchor domain-containing protein n=1 Tax=Micromonospora sonchi TaxID=1763543 RepID=A0A917U2P7_9ACTN|nr:hypothetical protein GCM10011608_39870 [Micromonospora sonchi]
MAVGRRWLSRTVATALLLLAGMAIPASPAAAVDTDPKFKFDLTGTTVSLGVKKKRIYLAITNLTDETPVALQFHVWPTELAWEKATVEWPEEGGIGECDGEPDRFYCHISSGMFPELLPTPGGTVKIPLDIHVREKHEPYEGRFEVQVDTAWDDDEPGKWIEERKWLTLNVVDDPEADLSVMAPDVKQSVRIGADGRLEATGPLNPGETGAVRYRIVNQGRKAVSGVKVTLRLPDGVSFTQPPKECVIDNVGRSAVCTYDTLALVPVDQDTNPKDGIHSAVELHNLVTVPATTKAPITLQGGVVQVEGLTEQVDAQSVLKRTELPANAVAVPAADVDASDNQDGFAIVVAAPRSDDDGGGGGLPVTGPPAGLITGAGLAMLAGGGIMLLLARRRNRLPHA